MKKSIVILASIIVISSLLSCKKDKPVEKITLTLAEVNPENSICGRMDKAFKEKVENLSKGQISVNISYSGTLGNEAQVIELMQSGIDTIQIARVSANLTSYGGKKSGLITIPYTFVNSDHFWKFAKSDIAKELLNEPYELGLGLKGLCYAEEGFRHFFSTVKIENVDDMKGKFMRVSGNILPKVADGLAAKQTKVAFTDLYMSLQTGSVQVADQPISNYLTNSFYKVAPYMILDGHMLGAVQILISSTCWDSLNEAQQKILIEAADYAADYCKQISSDEEEKALKQMINEGAVFTEIDDITPWQNACIEIIEEGSKDFPELYNQIINLK